MIRVCLPSWFDLVYHRLSWTSRDEHVRKLQSCTAGDMITWGTWVLFQSERCSIGRTPDQCGRLPGEDRFASVNLYYNIYFADTLVSSKYISLITKRCGDGTPLAVATPGAVSNVDQYQGQQTILLSYAIFDVLWWPYLMLVWDYVYFRKSVFCNRHATHHGSICYQVSEVTTCEGRAVPYRVVCWRRCSWEQFTWGEWRRY